ncbi:MAG TPA: 50S ribosomal protein L3 N(5)-glutamine methyltransferase, partial [Xanthomonadales bacterium]|nr:50S ribosomal protein L3 N(5)-glutamine methyltransferase [Xanthomonadales bacterium]
VVQAEQAFENADLHYGHGTDNARDEAVWLVLNVIGAPLDGSFQQWQQVVNSEQQQRICGLVKARLDSHKPLAYLLGSAWFAGLEFAVNEQVLVPRSPIAELIKEQFSPWVDATKISHILDLCTGSGCIAIACAVYLPNVRLDASDVSSGALELAAANVARHGVSDRVRLVQSDLFGELAGQLYDLIVTNPPYIAESGKGQIPDEYRAEPELGLYSGADGLDLCLRIMLQSPQHLHDGGMLICEVGESAERLAAILPTVPFMWLEFQCGGEGVFLLGREELLQAHSAVAALLEERASVG